MTRPPWHFLDSACQRYAFVRRWEVVDFELARHELGELASKAGYRGRDRYGRELWRSPKRTGGGMRWVVDPRVDRSQGELAQVIWVGQGRPPAHIFAGEA